MNVTAQLNYSHGYFYKLWADSWKVPTMVIFTITFPHTDADIIAHLLFVFAIHTREQVKFL